METPRVVFGEIEEGIATFVLYKDGPPTELLRYPVDNLPPGVDRDQFGCTFRPEFDDDSEIVALHYDEELTKQAQEEAQSAIEELKSMTENSE